MPPSTILGWEGGKKELINTLMLERLFSKGSLKGLRPFKNKSSPSPLKERGIKGVRLINNLMLEIVRGCLTT